MGSVQSETLDRLLAVNRNDRAPCIAPRGRVLVVNGYTDGREMYVDYLRFSGFIVDAATDPIMALQLVRLRAPDIIVTDFVFPTGCLDGPGFIARVRESLTDQRPPIIVVSGFTRQTDRQRAQHAGANRFLLKPCLPNELLHEVERAMATRRSSLAWRNRGD